MNILCGAVVVGGGVDFFFDLSSYKLISGQNSIKYGLRTKIAPQEGYGTRVLTSDGCGMRRHLRCSRCTAFFEQIIPVWNRLYEGTN
jgi:hypothetical protein